MGRRTALVIASDTYEDSGLQQLGAPSRDAQALAEVLADPAIGNFEVATMVNRPAHEVSAAIDEFFAESARDDLLLLYFSGHGVKDQSGRLYFAMSNTKRKLLGSSSVPAAFVNDAIDASRAKSKVVLLDCCFAGAFDKGMRAKADDALHTRESFSAAGTVVLTASDSAQYSFEGDDLTGEAQQSVFTRHLVAGMRGPADLDGDGEISIDELYDYVFDKVSADSRGQRPQKNARSVQGKLTIATCPATAAPLSAELMRALKSENPDVRYGMVSTLDGILNGTDAHKASTALIELQKLANDDSRRVSDAADFALRDRIASPLAALQGDTPAAPRRSRPDWPARVMALRRWSLSSSAAGVFRVSVAVAAGLMALAAVWFALEVDSREGAFTYVTPSALTCAQVPTGCTTATTASGGTSSTVRRTTTTFPPAPTTTEAPRYVSADLDSFSGFTGARRLAWFVALGALAVVALATAKRSTLMVSSAVTVVAMVAYAMAGGGLGQARDFGSALDAAIRVRNDSSMMWLLGFVSVGASWLWRRATKSAPGPASPPTT